MLGIIFSLIAGISMTIQGVFNTRLSEKVGLWETNAWVQGSAFIITLIVCIALGNGNIRAIKDVNKLYLLGGVFGAIITFTVMKGISLLGPTHSISAILIAQLTSAALIDALGLFSSKKIPFGTNEYIGVALMLAGIVIFKLR